MRILEKSEIDQVSGGSRVSFSAGGAALGAAIGDIIGHNATIIIKFIPGVATIQEVAHKVAHIQPDYIKTNLAAFGERIGRCAGAYIDNLFINT